MISTVGQRERRTQEKVVRYFRDQLGYRYLGNWQDCAGNINLERELLSQSLYGQDCSETKGIGLIGSTVIRESVGRVFRENGLLPRTVFLSPIFFLSVFWLGTCG